MRGQLSFEDAIILERLMAQARYAVPELRCEDMSGGSDMIGHDGRCRRCREIVFEHMWNEWQRRSHKPAVLAGQAPPVGTRRKRR